MVVDEGPSQADAGALRPLFGSPAGELRIDLVPAENPTLEAPFVRLDSGRYSQVLLGAITLADGTVSQFALKLQRHDYLLGAERKLTNPEIEAMWTREVDDLRKAASPHVVALAPFPPRGLASPPVFHCRKTQQFFHPPCPQTGAMLRDCRDDERLAEHGLPAWSQSAVRYLHHPTAAGPQTFYRTAGAVDERPRGGARVGTGPQLVRDWRALVHGTQPTEAFFACRTCEHRGHCFPEDAAADQRVPAEEVLAPLSFYDFRAVPMEVLDVTWDDLCDLLAGASWSAIKARATGPGHIGRRAVLDRLDGTLGGTDGAAAPRQWLFEHDPARLPLEVLRLKTLALVQVCEGLREIHRRCARPHFAIAPRNVMARFLPPGPGTPARWSFVVKVLDLGSAVPLRAPVKALGPMPLLLEPGSELRGTPFYPTWLGDGQAGHADRFQARVARREADGGAVRLVVEAEGTASLREFQVGDLALVLPSGSSTPWWSQIAEVRGKRVVLANEFAAGGDSPPALAAGQEFEASLTFFKNHGTPCDLHGLGMLIFRTLLVNDGNDLDTVHAAVDRCHKRLELATSIDAEPDGDKVQRLVLDQIEKEHRCFAPTAVLWSRGARDRAGDALDAELWQDLLLLAFRMTTRIPGFSFAASHRELNPNKPATLTTAILDELTATLRRQQATLFAQEQRDREIRAVCDLVRQELAQDLRNAPEPAAPAPQPRPTPAAAIEGFELEITDPDGKSQRRAFAQEYVSIGRKNDNLLMLDNAEVSRKHASIQRIRSSYVIEDLKSNNGTLVRGERIAEQASLLDGDEIVIGPYKLVFRQGAVGSDTSDDLDRTMVLSPAKKSDSMLRELRHAWAAQMDVEDDRTKALREVLRRRRVEASSLGKFALQLQQVLDQIAPEEGASAGGGGGGRDPALEVRALKALEAAAAALLETPNFTFADGGAVARFTERWQGYTAATLEWLVQATENRRHLFEAIELDVTNHLRRAGNPLETSGNPAEIARLLLTKGNDPAEADALLRRTIEDLKLMQVGLADGGQRVVTEVLERLDPKRIETLVGPKKGGLFSNPTQALWDQICAVHQELSKTKGDEMARLRMLKDSILKAHLRHSEKPRSNKDSK